MANQSYSETLASINSRIDELERKINIELSDAKKVTLRNEINQLDRNNPSYSTFKAAKLIQHTNYCNNLILQRQALLIELISKTINQQPLKSLILSNSDCSTWNYADIIRTITLIVNSTGIILATIFSSIFLSKK